MNLKKMLDREEEMTKEILKKHRNMVSHIIIEKTINGNDVLIPIFLSAKREYIKSTMESLAKHKPNYLIFVSEAYMKATKNPIENYNHGSLEREFKSGDKDILEVIIIQAYSKHGKLMRILEKKTLKKFNEDQAEFDGYLAVSDVQRVFFNEKESEVNG